MTNTDAVDQEFNNPRRDGEPSVSYDDQSVLWSGRPSQWVNAKVYFVSALFAGSALWANIRWGEDLAYRFPELSTRALDVAALSVVVLTFLVCAYGYLSVRYEKTTITPNKIREERGITRIFRRISFCELSKVTDIQGPPAGLLGILGLADIVFVTKDTDQASIKLRAIKDRDAVLARFMPAWRRVKVERRGYFWE